MDLARIKFTSDDFQQLLGFIQTRKLAYQPFRFDNYHEVGEGMAFLNATSTRGVKGVVNWPEPPADIQDLIVPVAGRETFQRANDDLRKIYDHFVRNIHDGFSSGIANLEFAEFGCNTGYFLFSLALAGAKATTGLDFTNNKALFSFFNSKLGIHSEFRFSEWDSFLHKTHYADVPSVDVCMSIAVLCHLADPLHHLSYLCSKARKAVFVWTPTHDSDDLFMSYGKPSIFPNSLSWPVSFDNMMKPSRGLLELCLKESGFEELRHVAPIPTSFDQIDFWRHHTGILAFRTKDAATAFTGGKIRRPRPGDVSD